MMKIGLVGAGFMGGMHMACYEALSHMDVKITAVADVREEKAKAVAEKTGATIYETGLDLIKNADVDIIDICLPTHLHTQHAVAAMKKGRAVFLEKPVCGSKEDAELLLKVQQETNAKVMVGQCIRSWSEYKWLKEAIDNNTYGKVLSGVFTRLSCKPNWSWNNWLNTIEQGGTVALDMHVHDVDYIRYIMGEPDEVKAVAARDTVIVGFKEEYSKLK
jgi:predicted dehydrogenase